MYGERGVCSHIDASNPHLYGDTTLNRRQRVPEEKARIRGGTLQSALKASANRPTAPIAVGGKNKALD